MIKTGKKGKAKQNNKIKLPLMTITPEEKLEILRILPDSVGLRDCLPYTTEFDRLYQEFKQHTSKHLSKNDFWRFVVRVAKASRKPQPVDINPSNTLSNSLLDDLHTMNPWWHGDSSRKIPESKRRAYRVLFDSLLKGSFQIVALRGPRQVGKTTIQQQMIRDLLEKKRLVSPQHIIRIQFDDLKSLAIDDPIVTIINWFEKNVVKKTFNNLANEGKTVYIFLDEIQDVSNWSAQLKHIVDHKTCRIFITGSSALRIFEGRESLAGRVHWNEINTLGLPEICQFRKMGTLHTYKTEIKVSDLRNKDFWIDFTKWNPNRQPLLDDVYYNFCDFGGYPFCHIGENVSWQDAENYLSDTVVARTIDHDLKANFDSEYKKKIGTMNSTLLRNVFKTFCKYSGMAIGLDKLCKEFRSSFSEELTEKQIQMILDFFEHSMLIKVVKPFEHRLKRARNERKICLCDHAIRKAWLKEDVTLYGNGVNVDIAGHVIEGMIGTFLASIQGVGVSYLPSGDTKNNENEIDFILEIGDAHIPIEIKYQENPTINSGIETFLNKTAYNSSFGLVVTKNEVSLDYFKKPNIIPIPAKKFLLLK
ncbi:MAG: AAA family ATPase [Planctomycetaceae bacterium]|nr:AAA family ATPase [Planctomycetaceae bacterium]